MSDEYLDKLGERIKKYRTMKKMSMQELADRTGYDSRASIYRIESGEQDIPHRKLKAIATTLGVDILDLVGEDDINGAADEIERDLIKDYNKLDEIGRIKLRAYLDALLDSMDGENK